MSDRELLEAAAMAAGLIGEAEEFWTGHSGIPDAKPFFAMYTTGDGDFFNPLNDDGDALRLAVKLKLGVIQWSDSVSATHAITSREYSELYGDDQLAATRRAITRAAAAIGGLSSDPSGKEVK